MIDVMKLAIERRTRALSDIEKLKEEVARLNQFIRVGEGLIARSGESRPVESRPVQTETDKTAHSAGQGRAPGGEAMPNGSA